LGVGGNSKKKHGRMGENSKEIYRGKKAKPTEKKLRKRGNQPEALRGKGEPPSPPFEGGGFRKLATSKKGIFEISKRGLRKRGGQSAPTLKKRVLCGQNCLEIQTDLAPGKCEKIQGEGSQAS